jgi:hypothetical protein
MAHHDPMRHRDSSFTRAFQKHCGAGRRGLTAPPNADGGAVQGLAAEAHLTPAVLTVAHPPP